MGLISALIFGLVVGIIAKWIMPGKDPGGCIITSLLGVVGAFIGQLIASFLFGSGDLTRWTLAGFIFAVLGALVLLGIYRMVIGRRR